MNRAAIDTGRSDVLTGRERRAAPPGCRAPVVTHPLAAPAISTHPVIDAAPGQPAWIDNPHSFDR